MDKLGRALGILFSECVSIAVLIVATKGLTMSSKKGKVHSAHGEEYRPSRQGRHDSRDVRQPITLHLKWGGVLGGRGGDNDTLTISSCPSSSRFTQSGIPVHRMVPLTVSSVAPPQLHLSVKAPSQIDS